MLEGFFGPFEAQGEWWVSGEPLKSHGALKYAPEQGFTLNLFDEAIAKSFAESGVRTIHGDTNRGPITVHEVVLIGSEISMRGGRRRNHLQLLGQSAILGRFAAPNATFRSALFHVSNLETFLFQDFFEINEEEKVVTVSVREKTWPTTRLRSGLTVTPLIPRPNLPLFVRHELELRAEGMFRLDADSPLELAVFEDAASSMSSLLTVLTAKPQHVDWFILEPESEDGPVEYIATPWRPQPARHEEHDLLLSGAHIEPRQLDLDRVLRHWDEIMLTLKVPILWYVFALRQERGFPPSQLVTFAQALEVFHRLKYGGSLLPNDVYEPIKKALLNVVSGTTAPEVLPTLKTRIANANDLPQKGRLMELVSKLPPMVQNRLGPTSKEIANEIVDVRNFYTHLSKGAESAFHPGTYRALRLVRRVFAAVMLQELGFDEYAIHYAISRFALR